jgi:hypothetical protein
MERFTKRWCKFGIFASMEDNKPEMEAHRPLRRVPLSTALNCCIRPSTCFEVLALVGWLVCEHGAAPLFASLSVCLSGLYLLYLSIVLYPSRPLVAGACNLFYAMNFLSFVPKNKIK